MKYLLPLLLFSCAAPQQMEKKVDTHLLLQGEWTLQTLRGVAPVASIPLPSLQIDLKENRISGNGGCNNYFASIEHCSPTALSFSGIGATRMLCLSENIESAYFKALQEVVSYKIQENTLLLFDKQGEEILKMTNTIKPLTHNQS
jgi:hypothetical protein